MGQIFDGRLFKPPGTFMDLDCGHDLTDRKAAVLGIPYDNGTHPHRVGARDGPREEYSDANPGNVGVTRQRN